MSNYYEAQQFFYDKLMEYRAGHPGFNFTLRRVFPEKQKRNYFIGSERSKYFGFTFWRVPFYYRGAATDFMNFMFQQGRDGKWNCHFQMVAPQAQIDAQIDLCGKAAVFIAGEIRKAGFEVREAGSKVKSYAVFTERVENGNWPLLWEKFIELSNKLLPLVDQAIQAFQKTHPDWRAARMDEVFFEKVHADMKKRRRAGPPDPPGMVVGNPDPDNAAGTPGKPADVPLNLILYGPPGTGKTYATVTKALDIIEPEWNGDGYVSRAEAKEKYDEYYEDERILVTSFHQSMAYEDFVEGIRPRMDGSGDSLTYRLNAGIFKQACARAAFECFKSDRPVRNKGAVGFDELYQAYLEHLQRGIDAGKPVEMTTLTGSVIQAIRITSTDSIITHAKDSVRKFEAAPKTKAKIRKLFERFSSIGEIRNLDQVREVVAAHPGVSGFYAVLKSLLEFKAGYRVEAAFEEEDPDMQKLIGMFEEGDFTDAVARSAGQYVKPVVLIIDEINRGNTAAILGELITLIEQDKRWGNEEQMKIRLPYSGADFYVPHNLYLIGTMNTADRSVEALDTALRRRFAFEQIPPRPDLLSPQRLIVSLWQDMINCGWTEEPYITRERVLFGFLGVVKPEDNVQYRLHDALADNDWESDDLAAAFGEYRFNGIDIAAMLTAINQRIEKLLDADRCIGHAHFMNLYRSEKPLEDLKDIFKEKIIPQLREYFYGDFGKIQLILGPAFVRAKEHTAVTFARGSRHDALEDIRERTVYEFTDPDELLENGQFEEAVKNIYQP